MNNFLLTEESAVEAGVIGPKTGGEALVINEFGVELVDQEEELASFRIVVEREEAILFLEACRFGREGGLSESCESKKETQKEHTRHTGYYAGRTDDFAIGYSSVGAEDVPGHAGLWRM